MKKIFLVVNDLVTATNFRKDLIKTLHNLGHDVAVISPSQSKFVNSSEILNDSQKLGFRHIHISINRVSLNPFSSFKYILFLSKILKSERPDRVLLYGPKIVIFGSIASRIAGVHKVYSTITGLGYAFASQSLKLNFYPFYSKLFIKLLLASMLKFFFKTQMIEIIFLQILWWITINLF